jgi:hypothetical protein
MLIRDWLGDAEFGRQAEQLIDGIGAVWAAESPNGENIAIAKM